MRLAVKTISIVTTVIVCSTILFAQASELTEKEVDALFEKATSLMRAAPYREVSFSQYYENSDLLPCFESTTILEFVPPNSNRIRSIVRSANGDSETELIYVGKDQYSKNEKGIWKRGLPGLPDGFVASSLPTSWLSSGGPRRSRAVTNVSHISNLMIDGIPTDFYEILETKYLDGEVEETSAWRTWFKGNGSLLKSVSEKQSSTGNLRRRITTTYEYDSSLKIEAPIP